MKVPVGTAKIYGMGKSGSVLTQSTTMTAYLIKLLESSLLSLGNKEENEEEGDDVKSSIL